MRSLLKGGGKQKQSPLASGGNFGKGGGGPAHGVGHNMRSGNHMPKGPGPVGKSHPKTGSQRSHFHSASGTSQKSDCFRGARKPW